MLLDFDKLLSDTYIINDGQSEGNEQFSHNGLLITLTAYICMYVHASRNAIWKNLSFLRSSGGTIDFYG
jgi:hypothetical protein